MGPKKLFFSIANPRVELAVQTADAGRKAHHTYCKLQDRAVYTHLAHKGGQNIG